MFTDRDSTSHEPLPYQLDYERKQRMMKSMATIAEDCGLDVFGVHDANKCKIAKTIELT